MITPGGVAISITNCPILPFWVPGGLLFVLDVLDGDSNLIGPSKDPLRLQRLLSLLHLRFLVDLPRHYFF